MLKLIADYPDYAVLWSINAARLAQPNTKMNVEMTRNELIQKISVLKKTFLGEKEVPAEAYYGVQTMRAVENFPITGYRIDEELIKAIGDGEKSSGICKYGNWTA